jgi:hypothetical protein
MIPQELLLNFDDQDRQILTEEAMADTAFGEELISALQQPDGQKTVALSAGRAVVNEFNPKLYPEMKGKWPLLRKLFVQIAKELPDIAENEIDKIPFDTKVKLVKEIASGKTPIGMAAFSDLGQDFGLGQIITTIAGSLIQAGGSVYNALLAKRTQIDINKIQLSGQLAIAGAQVKIAEAQKAVSQANVKIEETKAQAAQAVAQAESPMATLTRDVGGGIPLWAILVPVFILAIGGTYVAARR